MTSFTELDQLSSAELHQRAVHLAERRLDVRFFWRLLKAVPLAETAKGDLGEGQADVQNPQILVADAMRSDDGKLADALRPLYIDYLLEHP